ncbi:MAG: hypothetical protein R6U20_05670, partial [Longimonas sp.]|uniref:hypothetical protein n=1 Tax=Longimonas sp. TaxID=2039626 RepID=UPI0039767320
DGGIQPARFPNTHSAVPLEGSSHVLLTSEMLYCPFEGLAVADVSDPAYPRSSLRSVWDDGVGA